MKLTLHRGEDRITYRPSFGWSFDKHPDAPGSVSDVVFSSDIGEMAYPQPSVNFVEVKDSVSSPNPVTVGRIVGEFPILKSGEALIPPKVPWFHIPVRRFLIPPKILKGVFPSFPVRLVGESDVRFSRRIQKYHDSVERVNAWVALQNRVRRQRYERKLKKQADAKIRYLQKYEKRMEKYARRLRIYNERLRIFKRTRVKFKKAKIPHKYEQTNPYFRFSYLGDLTAYTVSKVQYFYPMGQRRREYQVWTDVITLPSIVPGDLVPLEHELYKAFQSEFDGLRAENRVKLQSKLSKQDFHLAKFFAEREQLFQSIHEKVSLLRDLRKNPLAVLKRAVAFNKGSPLSSARKVSNTVANETLLMQFGVKPLMHDMAGLVALLDEGPEKDAHLFFRQVKSRYVDRTILVHGLPMRATGILTHRYWVKYYLEFGVTRLLQRLGLVNPLEVAWEVMPWSFVVDWWLPIGNYLGQLSQTTGLRYETGTDTIQFRGTLRFETNAALAESMVGEIPPYDGDNHVKTSVVVVGDGTVLFTSRKLVTQDDLSIWLPDYLGPPSLSFNQMISATALVVQRLTK